jgi:hypothetical protein
VPVFEFLTLPSADITPAVRNALIRARTRLSATRSRTRPHHSRMLQFVETRRDISLEDPVIVPGPQGMNLSDRVLSTTPGAETVTNRFEVRLEHRLQHQHQRCLNHPIHRGRDTKAPQFATARLGNQTLPHRQRSKRAGLQLLPHLLQKLDNLSTLGDRCRAHPVHSGGPRTLVPCHPFPRDGEKVRVVDKVEHITSGRPGSPTAHWCSLHCICRTRRAAPTESGHSDSPIFISASVRVVRTASIRWDPLPCTRLSPARTTTVPPPHRVAIDRRRANPDTTIIGFRWRCGSHTAVPTFTAYRSTGEVPSYAPAISPRLRRRHSPWPPRPATLTNHGVANTYVRVGAHRRPAQIHRVRAGGRLEKR